jgi:hypothetical protein
LPELAQTIKKVGKTKAGFVRLASKTKPISGGPGTRGSGDLNDHTHLNELSFHAVDSDGLDVATRVPPPKATTSRGVQHQEGNEELFYNGDNRLDNMEGNDSFGSFWGMPSHCTNDRYMQMPTHVPNQGLWSPVPCHSFPSNYSFVDHAIPQELLLEQNSSKFMQATFQPSGLFQESMHQVGQFEDNSSKSMQATFHPSGFFQESSMHQVGNSVFHHATSL